MFRAVRKIGRRNAFRYTYVCTTVRAVSCHIVPSTHTNVTEKYRAAVVPVASVPVFRKLVPHVKTRLVVPTVVIANVQRCPAAPPEALNVQAPVGVIVRTPSPIATVIVPVVALVALTVAAKPGPCGPTFPCTP